MSGISRFYKTITSTSKVVSSFLNIGNWALGGSFSTFDDEAAYNILTSPTSIYYNGSTYSLGYESNTYDNQAWIVKQTGFSLETNKAGVGTNGQEPFNHPAPLLIIDDNGYIYVIQNEFHVTPFNLWRSDNPEDISSFSLIGQFDTDGAYLVLVKQDNTDAVFVTRSGDANSGGFHQSILQVNLLDASYTKTQVSIADYSTTDIRHYPLYQYRKVGNSTTYFGAIQDRRDSDLKYLKVSLWKTTDFVNFSNLDGTFTKDVVTNGAITVQELEDNYKFIQSNTNDNNISILNSIIQVDDDLYVSYNADDVRYLEKYTNGNNTASLSYVVPTDTEDKAHVWNGDRIFFARDTNGIDGIYSIDTNLANVELEHQLTKGTEFISFSYYAMPFNLHEIPSGSKYLGIGRSDTSQTPQVGVVPYNIFTK